MPEYFLLSFLLISNFVISCKKSTYGSVRVLVFSCNSAEKLICNEFSISCEYVSIKPVLEAYGFELIDDKRMRIIEQIKVAVIELVHYNDNSSKTNLSDYLTDKCHHDYSFLSKLFSEVNGISIERYYIIQKIERIKELLVYDELSISEIADKLNYSSAAHLSTQFRNMTGISPSQFKRLKGHKLKPLDEV